jgi:hypothetical protein
MTRNSQTFVLPVSFLPVTTTSIPKNRLKPTVGQAVTNINEFVLFIKKYNVPGRNHSGEI